MRRIKTNHTVKVILIFFLVIFIFLMGIIVPKSEVLPITGEYSVASVSFTYTDHQRVETYTKSGAFRKLNVKFWYPENGKGKYPLIVFSHGGFGTKTSNTSLYNELASHGYIVVSIDHTYQCFFTTDDKGKTTFIDRGFIRELLTEDARSNRMQSLTFYQKWMDVRMADINFVIDKVISETQKAGADAFFTFVDTTKIGVMGHSLGGAAALGIGRSRKDVRAVIALESPFMYDIVDVKDGGFVFIDADYPVPVLNVYSDSSWHILADRPQYARNYELLIKPGKDTHHVYIDGIGHLSLTDLALVNPVLVRILDGQKASRDSHSVLKTINKICLEFFDFYLKEKGEFRSDLNYKRELF